jgi:hypothetical protein
MDAYIYCYCADIYCADCGREMVDECRERSIADTGDSDQFPQGPYPDGGGEADCPQHCGDCGVFLRNPLTGAGDDYVSSAIADDPERESAVANEWREYYDYLTIDEAPRRTIHRTYDDWKTDCG